MEDSIVGNEGNAEPDGGGGDPTIGIVTSLAQCVPDPLAVHAELGGDEDQLRPRVDGFSHRNLGLESQHPRLLPPSQLCPETELGGSLERDERWPTDDDRLIALGKARTWDQICSEHVRVDDDGARGRLSDHVSRAARNAAPSSGVRSSITISSWGGNGLARCSSTAIGSSRLLSPEGWGAGSTSQTQRSGYPHRNPCQPEHALPSKHVCGVFPGWVYPAQDLTI